MTRKSKGEGAKINFSEDYKKLSDEALTDILKKRDHYLEEASNAAIAEAMRRGLIHSEQDLFAEKYRVEPLRSSLFPIPENETSRRKLQRSLTRSLLFLGGIIVAWGVYELLRHHVTEGVAFILTGIIWEVLSFTFFRSVNNQKINLLLLITVLGAVYTALKLFSWVGVGFVDIFIVVVLFGLVFYGLVYLKKL
ncbi:MAG: hypothetical protein CR996_00650 [Draconibacterium sp.]|nr:MAG: hypothetical protein CR996_00650 [Draconibacterium sp.]